MSSKKIVVLGTGGTIAGLALAGQGEQSYNAAQLSVDDLLKSVPQARSFECVSEQVAQIDSKDMSFALWRKLAARCVHWLAQSDVQGVVITHGSDTLEETAYFLHAVLNPAKPVVLTCAMRPANSSQADGPQNLADALAVASSDAARGVVAVCAGEIHGAIDVQKNHPYRLNAFSSGDAGILGYVDDGRLRMLREWPLEHQAAPAAFEKMLHARQWPQVEIVFSYAGVDGSTVRALFAQGVKGLVVAATGNGTLHQDLEAALLKAQAHGVRLVRATRCAQGRILAKTEDAIADSKGLSPLKARIALMLALM